MKTNKLSVMAVALLLTAACTNKDVLVETPAPLPAVGKVQFTDAEAKVLYQMRNPNHQVSLEEAMQLAYGWK